MKIIIMFVLLAFVSVASAQNDFFMLKFKGKNFKCTSYDYNGNYDRLPPKVIFSSKDKFEVYKKAGEYIGCPAVISYVKPVKGELNSYRIPVNFMKKVDGTLQCFFHKDSSIGELKCVQVK